MAGRSDDSGGLTTALRALGDPTRLTVFCALLEKERCVRDLVDDQALAQPLASHHLRVLERAGLIKVRRSDGFNLYSVDPAGMKWAYERLSELLDPNLLPPAAHAGGNPACCRG